MSDSINHEPIAPNQHPALTTIDGGTDFSRISPGELLAHRGERTGRTVLIDSGVALTADRQPVADAPDGATERLDGNYVTKLGGQVLGVSVSNENFRK